MKNIINKAAFAAVLLTLAPATGLAVTESTTFTVSATVLESCTVTALPLNFGIYSPSSATPTDATTTIAVACTLGTKFNTGLNAGVNGTFNERRMAGTITDNTLGYNLYTDASHTTVWGDGTGATQRVPGSGLGLLTLATQTVYGRIPIGQNIQADAFTDTITVTVEW